MKKISQYSDKQLHEISSLITARIEFINPELIPVKLFLKAEGLTKDIDIDDTEFVALTEHTRGKFWTGDKHLRKGLLIKNWDKLVSTSELYEHISMR